MNCCQCQGIEQEFDGQTATRNLQKYQARGPAKTTRILIKTLKVGDVSGKSLLDIGGGIGAIQIELLHAGISQVTSVEASTAYLHAAKQESSRQGFADRVQYHHADFVLITDQIHPADIVTLDRVICCYEDMPALVRSSVSKAKQFYALVYPRDTWYTQIIAKMINIGLWIKRGTFRVFIHPTDRVEEIIHSEGGSLYFQRNTIGWQVAVYTFL